MCEELPGGLTKVYQGLTKVKGVHVPTKDFQRYNQASGPIKTIEEITMERILERMKEELTLSSPNKTMMIVGLMLQGEFLNSKMVVDKMIQFGKDNGKPELKITKSLFSNCLHRWEKGKAPIMKYVEKNDEARYRINPLLARVALTDVFELTKKTGKFSERDLLLKVPELKSINYIETSPPTAPKAEPKVPHKGIPEEIHIKVTFSPIRVLFGFEK